MKYIFFAALIWGNTLAQKLDPTQIEDQGRSVEGLGNTFANALNFTIFDTRYEGLQGTYYFVPQWLNGDVFGKDGKPIKLNLALKYDCVNQELVMKTATDSAAIYPHSFKLFDPAFKATYEFSKVPQIKTKHDGSYFLIIHKSTNLIVKHIEKKFAKADFKGAYNTVNKTYDSFDKIQTYYLVTLQNEARTFKPKKQDILKLFGSNRSEVKQFWKENLIDPSNDAHLAVLFEKFKI
jgi:hypothetical protein